MTIPTVNYDDLKWMVTVAIIFGFFFAFGIGANDVANSFGSSVSAKSLTLLQAIMVASVMEASGALLLGAGVTGTIKSKIVDVAYYNTDESGPAVFMLGNLTALMVGSIWLLTATYLQMPVSTTHTVVASIVGFTIAAHGTESVNWPELKKIFISWIAAPVVTGAFSFAMFIIVKQIVLKSQNPFGRALIAFPIVVFAGVTVDLWLVLRKSNGKFGPVTDERIVKVFTPAAVLTGVGTALICAFLFVPILRNKIDREEQEEIAAEAAKAKYIEENGEGGEHFKEEADANDLQAAKAEAGEEMPWFQQAWKFFADRTFRQDLAAQSFSESRRAEKLWEEEENYDAKAEKLFRYVQVFTACLTSFAHGANDVANAIGPLSAIMEVQKLGSIPSKSEVKYWVLGMGGVAIGLGFIFFGYRIVKAVGFKITKITPSRGFCIELATALMVAVASYMNIPVSTTNCLVGATAGAALASGGPKAVEWFFLIRVMLGWAAIFFIAAITNGLVFSFCAFSPTLLSEGQV
jgi:Phosphate/sulphate permeases